MTRQVNDCFSAAEDMLSVDDARTLITRNCQQVTSTESVSLPDACGRILAEDIFSKINVPPTDNSAVDGYAFRFSDYNKTQNLLFNVKGRSAAGTPFDGELTEGDCVKIFTGAIMPAGCDTIAMIEDVEHVADSVRLPSGLKAGANRRFAGEDVIKGAQILAKGDFLRPQEIGRLACVGADHVPVYKKLRIALLSTGDELVSPGTVLPDGGIYDSNRYILAALLKKYGCTVSDHGIVEDKFETIRDTIADAASKNDLVITSGGVSMGDEDHVKAAVEANGSLHFWRIAIKPGRPLALGQIKGTPFVGLPGNPVAAMICAMQFVRPLIAAMSGQRSFELPTPIIGKAAFTMTKKIGRREWVRGRYHMDETGKIHIEKYSADGSGLISSLVWSNGIIELDENTSQINESDLLKIIPYSGLFE